VECMSLARLFRFEKYLQVTWCVLHISGTRITSKFKKRLKGFAREKTQAYFSGVKQVFDIGNGMNFLLAPDTP
jgi:hypothetical protein